MYPVFAINLWTKGWGVWKIYVSAVDVDDLKAHYSEIMHSNNEIMDSYGVSTEFNENYCSKVENMWSDKLYVILNSVKYIE